MCLAPLKYEPRQGHDYFLATSRLRVKNVVATNWFRTRLCPILQVNNRQKYVPANQVWTKHIYRHELDLHLCCYMTCDMTLHPSTWIKRTTAWHVYILWALVAACKGQCCFCFSDLFIITHVDFSQKLDLIASYIPSSSKALWESQMSLLQPNQHAHWLIAWEKRELRPFWRYQEVLECAYMVVFERT